jgi:hypothetical protein
VIRFIALWIVLSFVLVITTSATSFFVFRHVDLRYELFVSFVVTPAVQALAVVWATRPPDMSALPATLREAWHHPLVTPVLLLDTILLLAGWILRRHPMLGLSGAVSLQPAWLGIKAIAASLFFLTVVLQRPQAVRWRVGERITLMAFVAVLLAAGGDGFSPWIGRASDALLATWWQGPTVVRWVGAYAPLFTVGVAVTVAAGVVLGRRRRSLQVLCDGGVALNLAAAALVAFDVFLAPYVGEPSRSIALTFGSTAATLFLIAGILGAAPGPPGSGTR